MQTTKALHVTVEDTDLALPGGYVYAIVAPAYRALYIGQTAGYQGAIGRLAQHLSLGAGSTFRQRICSIHSLEQTQIGPVSFAAARLKEERAEFHDTAADYREAVEALCQYQLISAISSEGLRFGAISRVHINPRTRLPFVIQEAEEITQAFLSWLRAIDSPLDP